MQFVKWWKDGVLEVIFHVLSIGADMENLSIDSASIWVHESVNDEEKTEDKVIGCSIGGLTTKIHAIVDVLGNPVIFLLSLDKDYYSAYTVEVFEKVQIVGATYWVT